MFKCSPGSDPPDSTITYGRQIHLLRQMAEEAIGLRASGDIPFEVGRTPSAIPLSTYRRNNPDKKVR